MQLDRTLIAVHERSLLETFDLSLHVMRRYFVPLTLTFSAGAVPLAVLHFFLVGWMIDLSYEESYFYLEESGTVARYLWDMGLLIFLTAPLASIFATKFLGDAVFVERPSLRSVLRSVAQFWLRLVWCQLLVRGILIGWLLLLVVDQSEDFSLGIEFLLLGSLACYAGAVRAFRPFINEIILLECNPLLSRAQSEITIGRRSAHLHFPSSGDLLARWLGSASLAVLLTGAVFGTFLFMSGVFFNDWKPGPLMLLIVFPLSAWIVAGFMTVVRFLGYLDLRIRHEGWETELLLRAEAARLSGRVA